MGRYIERIDGHYYFTGNGCTLEEVIEKLAHYEDLEEQGRLIEQKHGKWYWADDGYCRCSECNQKTPAYEHEEALEARITNYCPYCGAKMELKELEGEKE